jgi:hypothetical protein
MIIKTISKFIVFILDTNLNLIELKVVNNNQYEIVGTSEVLREDKTLKLSTKFSHFWKEYFVDKSFDDSSQFYIFIGKQASFTDTRIVYTWVKSQNLFYGSEYFVARIPENIDIENPDEIRLAIEKAKSINSQDLLYSQEPRIGKK